MKLNYDEPVSNFALNFDLGPYTEVDVFRISHRMFLDKIPGPMLEAIKADAMMKASFMAGRWGPPSPPTASPAPQIHESLPNFPASPTPNIPSPPSPDYPQLPLIPSPQTPVPSPQSPVPSPRSPY